MSALPALIAIALKAVDEYRHLHRIVAITLEPGHTKPGWTLDVERRTYCTWLYPRDFDLDDSYRVREAVSA